MVTEVLLEVVMVAVHMKFMKSYEDWSYGEGSYGGSYEGGYGGGYDCGGGYVYEVGFCGYGYVGGGS